MVTVANKGSETTENLKIVVHLESNSDKIEMLGASTTIRCSYIPAEQVSTVIIYLSHHWRVLQI